MTLVLIFGNSQHVIQVADRRVTGLKAPKGGGALVLDEESGKCGDLSCPDARMAFGYTGLASWNGFETFPWILETLFQCAAPDYRISGIIKRFQRRATTTFRDQLAHVPARDRRLSVMFTGFLLTQAPPLIIAALVTNFQDAGAGVDSPEAWPEFQTFYTQEVRPHPPEFAYVQRIGAWRAVPDSELVGFRDLLVKQKPAKAVVAKAVAYLRRVAERPIVRGTVGKQASAIVVPADPLANVRLSYHSAHQTPVSFMPSSLHLFPRASFMTRSVEIRVVDPPPGAVLAGVRPRRNDQCPCGSGKKYKKCHGRL